MSFFESIFSWPCLQEGLSAAIRNCASPGPDGITVAQFVQNAESELERLRHELFTGTYRPLPAQRFLLPKPDGGERPIVVGCVRDRVLQHATAKVLTRLLDPMLHDSAYGWRPGRSALQALRALEQLLDGGRPWVLRADIARFFESVPHAPLLEALKRLLDEPPLINLIQQWLESGQFDGSSLRDPVLGIGQGSPIAPLLANLYLLPFDKALEAAGFGAVRFGDDFCIAASSREEAESAQEVARFSLERAQLSLRPEKLLIRHRDEGFSFLGFELSRAGRAPGQKARQRFVARIESLLQERPLDYQQELDRMLHGWSAYYGSFEGVPLPSEALARLEAISLATEERRPPFISATREDQPEAPLQESTARPASAQDPWLSAASALQQGAGVECLPQVSLSAHSRAALLEALRRYDGGAASEILAEAGHYYEAERVLSVRRPVPARCASEANERNSGSVAVPCEDDNEAFNGAPSTPESAPIEASEELLRALLVRFAGSGERCVCFWHRGTWVEREVQPSGAEASLLRDHLRGRCLLSVYPVYPDGTVRFVAIRLVSTRKRREAAVPQEVTEAAQRAVQLMRSYGLSPLPVLDPGRGYRLWLFFSSPVLLATAGSLLQRLSALMGEPSVGIKRVMLPSHQPPTPEHPDLSLPVPLGLDPWKGERHTPLSADWQPLPEPLAALCEWPPLPTEELSAVLSRLGEAPVRPVRPSPPMPDGQRSAASIAEQLVDTTRSRAIYEGCVVIRQLFHKAIESNNLSSAERFLLVDSVGRLGEEEREPLEAAFRYLMDYRPGMVSQLLRRIYPYPMSCARIRERFTSLTETGCDCRFRVPPGAYPNPMLHAMGASSLPQEARRSLQHGARELGARAAAICAQLSQLRGKRQQLEVRIAELEAQLEALLQETGAESLETPAGRLTRSGQSGHRFVLAV